MSLNFQQVYERIHEIGLGARERQEKLEGLRLHARHLLDAWADKADELRAKLERARQHDPSLRCALPLGGRLDASHPAPVDEKPLALPHRVATLIAADGSQINPDRHAALLYSLINVGALVMEIGSGRPPEIFTFSDLQFGDELYTETGMVNDEMIALGRDLAERRKLLDLAAHYPAPVIALTDGPVELWGAKDSAEDAYRKSLEKHLGILSQLQARGVTVAGYVDKPGAELVVRLLEIATLPDEKLKDIRRQHPLRGVTDLWLYGGLLGAGRRSAVFGLQSGSYARYTGDLSLHFFYLNAGSEKHPSLARIEIPKWVADDEEKLNLLHAALLGQCRMMGAHPYPYILHRAHEIAVVKLEEKQQVEAMLAMELRRGGSEVGEESNKSAAKNLPGKRRFPSRR
jgi:hypothetical protein